jgi:hypothetical protein
LRGYVDAIHQAGGELAVIGNGKPEDAKKFIVDQQVSFPLYTDPSLRSYEAGGFHNGYQVSAEVLWKSIKGMAQGHFQTTTKGTGSQDGGAYVIDTDGDELFRYIGKDSSDHPAPELFLEALAKKR